MTKLGPTLTEAEMKGRESGKSRREGATTFRSNKLID